MIKDRAAHLNRIGARPIINLGRAIAKFSNVETAK